MRSHQKGEFRPAIRGGGGGGGGCWARYEKWEGGWGEGVLSASGPIRKVGRGGGGEGCLPYDDTMIYIFVLCARA